MRAMTRAAMRARRGATLVELLVAMTLLAVVTTAAVGVVARQWRLHAALDGRRAAREQLVAAAQALRAALRPASGDGEAGDPTDLVTVSDTLLEVRATIGASVVCAVIDARTAELPPESTVAPSLTWWLTDPQPGDVAVVHGGASDAWQGAVVDTVSQRRAGCAGSPLVRAAEAGLSRLRLHVATALAGVVPGAPVRVVRSVRYLHYKASDGRWYLGEREWDGTAWTGTQPVAGPLRAPGARGGLALVARDSAGAAVSAARLPNTRVVAVDVVLRSDAPAASGVRGLTTIDTLALRIALRNGG
ncbi:MAG: prepilin-type N-terminal cleavage/methylation domain-containing protein [Gemmatirosa sp.]|nr:prepilin-type N-terminal cleavage/methylation domain-containing protein [Gemmatirosa sp.]